MVVMSAVQLSTSKLVPVAEIITIVIIIIIKISYKALNPP